MDTYAPWPATTPMVVLSPHLDDGVFSCGGTIASAAITGVPCTVVTVFTGTPRLQDVPPSLRPFCDYVRRKAEDRRALRVLGVGHGWLDFVERAFEAPPLKGFASVFQTPAVAALAEFLPNLDAIERAIENLLSLQPRAVLLAPLGVGNHIDHVAVFVAAARVMSRHGLWERFLFYEDAYALGARARGQHFVTQRRPWSRHDRPENASIRARLMFAALAWARRGPPLHGYVPGAAHWRWRYTVTPICQQEPRKLEAVFQYESQVALLGGARAWGDLLRRYHRCFGGGEPLWQVVPPETCAA